MTCTCRWARRRDNAFMSTHEHLRARGQCIENLQMLSQTPGARAVCHAPRSQSSPPSRGLPLPARRAGARDATAPVFADEAGTASLPVLGRIGWWWSTACLPRTRRHCTAGPDSPWPGSHTRTLHVDSQPVPGPFALPLSQVSGGVTTASPHTPSTHLASHAGTWTTASLRRRLGSAELAPCALRHRIRRSNAHESFVGAVCARRRLVRHVHLQVASQYTEPRTVQRSPAVTFFGEAVTMPSPDSRGVRSRRPAHAELPRRPQRRPITLALDRPRRVALELVGTGTVGDGGFLVGYRSRRCDTPESPPSR